MRSVYIENSREVSGEYTLDSTLESSNKEAYRWVYVKKRKIYYGSSFFFLVASLDKKKIIHRGKHAYLVDAGTKLTFYFPEDFKWKMMPIFYPQACTGVF